MIAPRIRPRAGAVLLALLLASPAFGQDASPRAAGGTGPAEAPKTGDPASAEGPASTDPSKPPTAPAPTDIHEWFRAPFSQEADRDGSINTDRPTFTPSQTVVPPGRVQFESGFTFNQTRSGPTRTALYDFPELAMRVGLAKRLEFRTFWAGQTDAVSQSFRGGPRSSLNGPGDMEVGLKWQLHVADDGRKWIPTTALITSIMAPTGGTSPYSSQTVQPYINLIYYFKLAEKLSVCGSTGYLGMRQQAAPGSGLKADRFERFQQSLVAFYAANKRTTLFYEWYVFTFTNAVDNRPQNYMNGGIIYLLTPNIQVDLRAGFGLSGRPDDFFAGSGFSIRF